MVFLKAATGVEPDNERRMIIAVALVTAFCLLGDSMLYIALPVYWQEAGLNSLWEGGVLLSANRLVRLPLNPLIGWLYTKISLRSGLLIAVVLAFLPTTGYGVAQGFWIWLALGVRGVWLGPCSPWEGFFRLSVTPGNITGAV